MFTKLKRISETARPRVLSRARFFASTLLLALVLGGAIAAQAQEVDTGARQRHSSGQANGQGASGHHKHKPGPTPAPVTPPPGIADPFWDLNGTTAGAGGATPTGVWSTSAANWNPVFDGTGAVAVWVNGSDAVFSAGTDATGSYTVSFANNATVSANSITFEEGSPTFSQSGGSNSTVSVGAGGITINSGAGSVTFTSAKVTLSISAAQSWINNSSNPFSVDVPVTNGANLLTISGTGNTTISGVIGSSPFTGGLTKSGTGILTLSGTSANTYTGTTTVNAGELDLSKTAGVNAIAGNLIIGDGTGTDTVKLINADQIANTSDVTINSPGVLNLNNKNETIDALSSSSSTASVTLGTGTLTVGANNESSATFAGVISGTGGNLSKTGSGTQTLSGANTYTGATTINAGTLKLDSAGSTTARLANTSGITVNSGGTLLLANSSGTASTDRINNSANVTINGGGTFNTGGLSEGTRPTNGSSSNGVAGMGALTLQNTTSLSHAVIDFGSITAGSSLVFSSLSAGSKGAFVDILNWGGLPQTDNGATNNDRLLFATDPGFTAVDLANFTFNGAPGAMEITYGNMFEIVPIPEPGTWVAGGLALGGLLCWQRRRFARFFKRGPQGRS